MDEVNAKECIGNNKENRREIQRKAVVVEGEGERERERERIKG